MQQLWVEMEVFVEELGFPNGSSATLLEAIGSNENCYYRLISDEKIKTKTGVLSWQLIIGW